MAARMELILVRNSLLKSNLLVGAYVFKSLPIRSIRSRKGRCEDDKLDDTVDDGNGAQNETEKKHGF